MAFTEEQLQRWSLPITEAHQTKCIKTIEEIKSLLASKFGNKVTLFLQGSYKNRTNIKIDSDVDIVVRYDNISNNNLHFLTPDEKTLWEIYRTPPTYSFSQFKNEVEAILKERYPYSAERKNKCIRINESQDRVKADVVPCFVHKRLKTHDESSSEGIHLYTDDKESITSFPEQHYISGNSKNKATNYKYKAVIRAIKHIRKDLVDKGIVGKDDMSSFFLESLVWNTPDNLFNYSTMKEGVQSVVRHVWYKMYKLEHNDYAEVSDLQWLFRGGSHDPKKAEDFMWKVLQSI